MTDACSFVCFEPLRVTEPSLFTFAEFLSALALLVLVWTISDPRYKFRVSVAPFPLRTSSFWLVAIVGILILLTDLWRSEKWLVPVGGFVSPALWQAVLAGLLFAMVLVWAWFAFVRPPLFGKRNALRYVQAVFTYILKGSPQELAVIADEIRRSARPIVQLAPRAREFRKWDWESKSWIDVSESWPNERRCANDLLLLLADTGFCNEVATAAPGTALALFEEARLQEKPDISLGTFGRNVFSAALLDKNSFVYREQEGYDTGLIGYVKPVTQAMFGSYHLIGGLRQVLDIDFEEQRSWTHRQWEAYLRCVLITFADYAACGTGNASSEMYRVLGDLKWACMDVGSLDGNPESFDDERLARFRVVIRFMGRCIELLESDPALDYVERRIEADRVRDSIYDDIAENILELTFTAGQVRSPTMLCWTVQHNTFWSQVFDNFGEPRRARSLVLFKARRKIYDCIVEMEKCPNYKGARVLACCLNVMGLTIRDGSGTEDSKALHKAILSWVKRNFAWVHAYNSDIADSCLVENMAFEPESLRITRSSPSHGLRRRPTIVHFEVDPIDGERLAALDNVT